MSELAIAAAAAILSPALCAVLLALWMLSAQARPSERASRRLVGLGLATSLIGSAAVLALHLMGYSGEVVLGSWIKVGTYEVPLVVLVDDVAVVFSLLAAAVTALTSWFSSTYLHKEAGFTRFFVLLGLFGSGAQLVALGGSFDLFFAGWELLGLCSALFIGFFFERQGPIQSSMRAFATYRLCDMAFFLGIIATHEVFGSTRLSILEESGKLPAWESHTLAALFLIAALGKSAQLPFSSWLARAMDGPTPSSALFYGAVSIHAGLYLMLRVWPLLDVAPLVEVLGVVIGIATAIYASIVARTHADAKGVLAKATLAQTGLILAEIAAGFTTLALVHLVGHAMLRLWQFLRTPNTLHDAHRRGHGQRRALWIERWLPAARVERLYASALHRFRLDDLVDAAVAPILVFALSLDRADRRMREIVTLDRQPQSHPPSALLARGET